NTLPAPVRGYRERRFGDPVVARLKHLNDDPTLGEDPGDKGCGHDGAFRIRLHAGIARWVAEPVNARGAVETAQELHELAFVLGPNSRNLRLLRWVGRRSPTSRRIGANIGVERRICVSSGCSRLWRLVMTNCSLGLSQPEVAKQIRNSSKIFSI